MKTVTIKVDEPTYIEIKNFYIPFFKTNEGDYIDFFAKVNDTNITGYNSKKKNKSIVFVGQNAETEASIWKRKAISISVTDSEMLAEPDEKVANPKINLGKKVGNEKPTTILPMERLLMRKKLSTSEAKALEEVKKESKKVAAKKETKVAKDKKEAPNKVEAKKSTTKKVEAKKTTTTKKVEAKKSATTKKVETKKTAPKKAETKKVVEKKVTVKKETPKKVVKKATPVKKENKKIDLSNDIKVLNEINPSSEWLDNGDQIGSDEVGTGDFIGPMIVVGCVVRKKDIPLLKKLGVKDSKKLSDGKIKEIAPILAKELEFSKLTLGNDKYNTLIITDENLNSLKAKLHNRALLNLSDRNPDIEHIYIDQFVNENKYYEYLNDPDERQVRNVIFRTKGETLFPSVAAASIIARYAFLQEIEFINQKYDIDVPLGAGPRVNEFAKDFIRKFGILEFNKICKRNFANYKEVIKG